MRSQVLNSIALCVSIVSLIGLGCTPEGNKKSGSGGMIASGGTTANTGGKNAGGSANAGGAASMGGAASNSGGSMNGNMMNPINDCPRTVPNDYVCNPYCNLGCQRGEHCTISNNVFACVPTGAGELGSPCEQSSDCGHKMACFRITGESVSTCRQFCNSDGECPGERKCELGVNFGSGSHQFCSDIAVGCDPFLDNMTVAGGGGMSMVGGMSMAGGGAAGGTPAGGAPAGGAVAGGAVAGGAVAGGAVAGGAPAGGAAAGGAMAPVMAMCDAVQPNEFGACDQELGWSMNPEGVCTRVSGCGCGNLCGKVYETEKACQIACFGRAAGAPFCDPIQPNEFGACEALLGFGVDADGNCAAVSGCGCGNLCTGRVYDTIDECTRICLHGEQPAAGGMAAGGAQVPAGGGVAVGGAQGPHGGGVVDGMPATNGGAAGPQGGEAAGGGAVDPQGGEPAGGGNPGGAMAPAGGAMNAQGGQAAAGGQGFMNFFQERMSACAEDQGCYLSRDATKCMSAGMLQKGEKCDAPNACAPGLHCLVECTEVCSTKAGHPENCGTKCPDPSPEVIMAIGRDDVEKFDVVSPENEVGVCLSTDIPGCDIFGDECEAGRGCYNVRGGRACLPEGTGEAGAACTSATNCKQGHVCLYGVCLPYCRDSADTPDQHKCAQKCPGNTVILTPLLWQGGACTNVMAANTCDFWAEGADCNGDVCVPTPVGEICRPATGMGGVGDGCSDTTDCQKGLVCPRQVGQCKTACSIEPFVDGGFTPPICMDDCPSGPGMAIAPESRIGYCP